MRTLLLATTLALLSFAPLSAQGPSWTAFGQGCPGSGGQSLLRALTLPQIDTEFCLEVSVLPIILPFSPPGLLAWVFGFSNTVWGNLNLPYNLANLNIDFLGCTAYVAVDHVFPANHNGITPVKFKVKIPNDASLAGLHFFNQVAFLDLTGLVLANRPLAVSNAGAGTVNF